MKRAFYLFAICVSIPAFLIAENKPNLESLPRPVQAAIKKELGTLPILSINREKDQGKVEYEVETRYNGKSRSYSFNSAGKLLEIEDAVDIDSIPAAAKTTLQKKAAGGSIQEVEKVTSDGKVSYEADITTSAGKKIEVSVTAGGAIRSLENGDQNND